jgi:outer membrane lipoprotein-sorting protein
MFKQWKSKSLFAFVIIFFCGIPVFALTNKEAEELVKYADDILYPKECRMISVMNNLEGRGRETENKIEVWRKDDKFLVIFLTPPIQKGQKFLMNDENMWMYLPKSKRVMRISAKEKSMGGEANNSDVMRVDLVKDYNIKYLCDENMNNTMCYKLELSGKNRKVAYNKVIYWISKNGKMPVKRELYSISGKLMKNWYFEDIKVFNNVRRPAKMIIENALNKEYRTEIIFLEIDEKARFKDNMFQPTYLKTM